jgi:putative component of toxin-antitoxin plasmid stabilization module
MTGCVAWRTEKLAPEYLARLDSAQLGNLGDVKSVVAGIREMRIHFWGRLSCLFRTAWEGVAVFALRR